MQVIKVDSIEEAFALIQKRLVGEVTDAHEVDINEEAIQKAGYSLDDLCMLEHTLDIMRAFGPARSLFSNVNHLAVAHGVLSAAQSVATFMKFQAEACRFVRGVEEKTGHKLLPEGFPSIADFELSATAAMQRVEKLQEQQAAEAAERAEAEALANAAPVGNKPH